MKQIVMALSVALLLSVAGCKPSSQTASESAGGSPANASTRAAAAGSGFDFYLLNLSWSPEFCHGHPNAAECAAWSTFVLHGLWPENTDGSYPEKCSAAPGPSNPAQYADIYPDPGLLQHEWQTHGTCSGLSADAFFAVEICLDKGLHPVDCSGIRSCRANTVRIPAP
jgi:ribonuclease T2